MLDRWFEQQVTPRLRGRAFLVRYADDAVLAFAREDDARRVLAVLGRRLARYGLTLHPDKTRLVDFRRAHRGPGAHFDLLGFRHFWAKSRRGRWVVTRKTAADRMRRALQAIGQWCRSHRHRPLREQQRALSRMLTGHAADYGITGNGRALARFHREGQRRWRYWLNRRSRKAAMPWARFRRLLAHYPLPPPRVIHSIYA